MAVRVGVVAKEKENNMSFTFSAVAGLVKGIFKPACDLIDNLHVSDEERLEAQAKLDKIQLDATDKFIGFFTKVLEAQSAIIQTEMKGNWLQKSWRPLLMLIIITIIFNNYLFMPYITAFTGWELVLELPNQMWNLLTAGVSGYVVGRSAEKVATTWKQK